jgi:hypothetical protein
MWFSRFSLFAAVALAVTGCIAVPPTRTYGLAFRCVGQSDQFVEQYGMESLIVTSDDLGPVLEYSDRIGAPARFYITPDVGRCTIQPAR